MKTQPSRYVPKAKVLEKYADLLVNFALESVDKNGRLHRGVRKGETVRLTCWEEAKPLYLALQGAVARAGGFVLPNYLPHEATRHGLLPEYYTEANMKQLKEVPHHYLDGVVKTIDHEIIVLADSKQAFAGVDPKKIATKIETLHGQYMSRRTKKENQGKLSWTLALYGTEEAAREAGLSLEEYWQQIIKACYLDKAEPTKVWAEKIKDIEQLRTKLNRLDIDTLQVVGARTNLTIKMGAKRQWLGGSGRNIPSFEIFTSPDWRGTKGVIFFDLPLYQNGVIIKDIELTFKKGKIVKARASQNEKVLHELLRIPGARQIGEFSLTDKRFSKIGRFMAETLYDENYGGKYGNTHLAIGQSYHDTYTGNLARTKPATFAKLGFNKSSIHTDIIQTADRTVTATLTDGTEMVIYKKGKFLI